MGRCICIDAKFKSKIKNDVGKEKLINVYAALDDCLTLARYNIFMDFDTRFYIEVL